MNTDTANIVIDKDAANIKVCKEECIEAPFEQSYSQYTKILEMIDRYRHRGDYLDIGSFMLSQETMVIIKYTIERNRKPNVPIRYELLIAFSDMDKVFKRILQVYRDESCTLTDFQKYQSELNYLFNILHRSIYNLSTVIHEGNYTINMDDVYKILDKLKSYIIDSKRKYIESHSELQTENYCTHDSYFNN
jgi:hypothetical protein